MRHFLTLALIFVLQTATFAQYEDNVMHETDAASASGSTGRQGMWQGGKIDFDFLPKNDGIGYKALQSKANVGLPSPVKGHFLLVSPSFEYHKLDELSSKHLANDKVDLYSAGGMLSYVVPYTDNFLYDVSIDVTWNGDGKARDSDAVSVMGLAGVLVTSAPNLQWMFGLAYTDRSSWRVLPVVGVDWKPSEEWRFELTIPKPKIARRLDFLPYDEDSSYWAYGGVTVGAFRGVFEPIAPVKANNAPNAASIQYLDYRVMLGVERNAPRGIGWNAEIGTAFGGYYELESLNGRYWREKQRPGANLFFKTGISF